jgi:hypothetical protein
LGLPAATAVQADPAVTQCWSSAATAATGATVARAGTAVMAVTVVTAAQAAQADCSATLGRLESAAPAPLAAPAGLAEQAETPGYEARP